MYTSYNSTRDWLKIECRDCSCMKLEVVAKKKRQQNSLSRFVACVAGRIRERASGGGAAITSRASAREGTRERRSHILYDFCLPPTIITLDEQLTKPIRERSVT